VIVCLYTGWREDGPKIDGFTESEFGKMCGDSLLCKGFDYKFTYSYDDAIKKLTKVNAERRCPYSELWLLSSVGTGVLSSKAKDKDSDKIIPFLEAVKDFWIGGGGLLLFCDDVPYKVDVRMQMAFLRRPNYG
jgi:hypothetical protein